MAYEIKVEAFEGPFDLLLHLININEIEIHDIPIHEITRQYLEYMDLVQDMDMELASEFLVMAATLIEIKSKMLLPSREDEMYQTQFDLGDPRADLVNKLVEYKKYKNVAGFLKGRETEYGKVVLKGQEDLEPFVRTYTNSELNADMDSVLLIDAVKRILNNLNKEDTSRKGFFHSLKRDAYTVEQKMDLIKERVLSYDRVAFDSLFSEDKIKSEVIVTFLAILELLKLKVVLIKQDKLFDTIEIRKNDKAECDEIGA
jgi:segregation and condensation protein A